MNDMLDRIVDVLQQFDLDSAQGKQPYAQNLDDAAKAVVGAIKEPSQRMMYAGGFFHIQGGDAVTESDANAARRTWRAMVDAILVGGA